MRIPVSTEALRLAKESAMRQDPSDAGALYGWVTCAHNHQSLVAFAQHDGKFLVMADSDKRRLLLWRPAVEALAKETKTAITLVRFSAQETLETIEP